MKGRISYIANRMKLYDDSEPSKFITCLDAGNLYG